MTELIVVGFDQDYRAAEVLNELRALDAVLAIELRDAVAVYRTAEGKLEVEKSVQTTTKQGTTRGAVLGALLGAILVASAGKVLRTTLGSEDLKKLQNLLTVRQQPVAG